MSVHCQAKYFQSGNAALLLIRKYFGSSSRPSFPIDTDYFVNFCAADYGEKVYPLNDHHCVPTAWMADDLQPDFVLGRAQVGSNNRVDRDV
jgi:hypothetical protein